MRRAILPALVLLPIAACKPAATPAATATAAATATPGAVASGDSSGPRASTAPMGSALSADVSPLAGTITGLAVRTSDLGTIVALDADVLFDFDKAVLRPDATAALGKTADLIRAGGTGAVAVFGYTDAKGDDDYNLELSRQRAQAVTDWLLTQPGVKAHAFEVRGKGEADPVAANALPDGSDNPAGRAKNRRVEIVIPTR